MDLGVIDRLRGRMHRLKINGDPNGNDCTRRNLTKKEEWGRGIRIGWTWADNSGCGGRTPDTVLPGMYVMHSS